MPVRHVGASPTMIRDIDRRIDALPRVGLSRAAWFALMLTFFFANYDIAVFALAIPGMSAQLGLAGVQLGFPVAANLVAFGVGASVIGYIADRRGRQTGIFLTALILGVGGILTAVAWDLASVTAFRFLTGCGMGAVIALCTAYVGESTSSSQRGGYQARLFFVGAILQLVIGFASLPLLAATPDAWRYLFAFGGAVLVVLGFINSAALTESPRWLAAMGRVGEADVVVRRMEERVGVTPGALPQEPEDRVEQALEGENRVTLRALLRPPYLKRLLIVLGFWFVFYIPMYGFGSYLPLILQDLGLTLSDAMFVTVIARIAPVVSAFLVVLLVERVERRTLVVASVLVFAAAMVVLGLGLGQTAATASVLLATFALSFFGPPAYTYTAEIFPTRARATAAAIGDGFGHVGGAVAPFIVLPLMTAAGAPIAVLVMAGLAATAGVVLRFGPRTRGLSLEDVAADPVDGRDQEPAAPAPDDETHKSAEAKGVTRHA